MRCTSVSREFAVLSPVWVWANRMGKWPWVSLSGVRHGFRHLGWTWRLWLWFQSVFQSVSGRIRPQFLAQKWAVIRWQQVGLELSSAWCSSRGLLDPNRDRSAVRLWCAGGLKSQQRETSLAVLNSTRRLTPTGSWTMLFSSWS